MFEKIWITPAGLDLTFHIQSISDFEKFTQICDAEEEVYVRGVDSTHYLELLQSMSKGSEKIN